MSGAGHCRARLVVRATYHGIGVPYLSIIYLSAISVVKPAHCASRGGPPDNYSGPFLIPGTSAIGEYGKKDVISPFMRVDVFTILPHRMPLVLGLINHPFLELTG